MIAIGVVFFLLVSTNYIPKKLIYSIEKTYSPIELSKLSKSETYYIHVLGAGASVDKRLPASMNLNGPTLTRLCEGIRVYNYLDQGVLVTSASTEEGLISQAQLSKQTAIAMGVPEVNIKTLDTPNTTLEEAIAFKEQFGGDKNIVLVTSALHMPRAMEIFQDQGLNVIPAPASYIYKESGNTYNGITIPSFKSVELFNYYHLTVLKLWYYRFLKK